MMVQLRAEDQAVAFLAATAVVPVRPADSLAAVIQVAAVVEVSAAAAAQTELTKSCVSENNLTMH